MNAEEYIKSLVETVPEYTLSNDDKKCIQFEGIEKYIHNKLSSSKYKSTAMPKSLKDYVKTHIDYCVANKLPINIMFPFGAYKRWSLPTYPGIDFAEVFNVVIMREYLAPIAKAYEYGVILNYASVELFVERINHIPQLNLDLYQKEFLQLIEAFSKFLPKGLQLKYRNLREEISQEDALKAVDIEVEELRKNWTSVSEKEKELEIKRAKVSCMVDFKDPKYNDIILDAVFAHEAFSSGCWKQNGNVVWIAGPDMIKIGNSYTEDWGIHIKSSQSSRVNFWVGMGALLKKGDTFMPTILSYAQYLQVKDKVQSSKVEYFNHNFRNLNEVPSLIS